MSNAPHGRGATPDRDRGGVFERYLRILGFRNETPSGREGLDEIVRRHLCRVPFENISKLLLFDREGAGRPLTLAEFLDGIESRDLGGTCYSSNPFLAELLRAAGYDADLLGADMSTPNIHTSIRVHLAGADYHVDVGYAAPFRTSMSLNALPHVIREGEIRYVFDRGATRGEYALTAFRGSEREQGYIVHDPPRTFSFFEPVIVESFLPGKFFMNRLRVTKFFDDYSLELHNAVVTRSDAHGTTTRTLRRIAELRNVIANDFEMPRCPVEQAVAILERLTGKALF